MGLAEDVTALSEIPEQGNYPNLVKRLREAPLSGLIYRSPEVMNVSLYGIESDEDCRNKIDEILRSPAFHGTVNKETVSALKSVLSAYYRSGDSEKGQRKMSRVESAFFWPAIQEAYVRAPKLSSPSSWKDGVAEIEMDLKYRRPTNEE